MKAPVFPFWDRCASPKPTRVELADSQILATPTTDLLALGAAVRTWLPHVGRWLCRSAIAFLSNWHDGCSGASGAQLSVPSDCKLLRSCGPITTEPAESCG